MTTTAGPYRATAMARDPWAQWALEGRAGGDECERRRLAHNVDIIRDRIIRAARLRPRDIVVDLGCGTGVLGLGALAREPLVRAIFVDHSPELLDRAQAAAHRLGVAARASFLLAPAETFAAVVPNGADVVVSRAVLIHIHHKAEVLRQIHAVLAAGGRLSLCEPVNTWSYPEPDDRFWGYDVVPVHDIAAKLKALYYAHVVPGTDPFVDFNEHDLWNGIEAAGFRRIHMRVERKTDTRVRPRSWATFAATQWNPRSPSLAEAMRTCLSSAEHSVFVTHMRPLVENGSGMTRWCVAYARAEK